MSSSTPYFPADVFSDRNGPRPSVCRRLIALSRYIQGDRVFDHLGLVGVAMTLPIRRNEPFEVTKKTLLAAVLQAHEMGLEIERSIGNAEYNFLHKS